MTDEAVILLQFSFNKGRMVSICCRFMQVYGYNVFQSLQFYCREGGKTGRVQNNRNLFPRPYRLSVFPAIIKLPFIQVLINKSRERMFFQFPFFDPHPIFSQLGF